MVLTRVLSGGLIVLFLSLSALTVLVSADSQFRIDSSICNVQQDRQVYESCVDHYRPIQEEADRIRDDKNALYGEFNAKTSDYSVCWNQVCALGSSDPQNAGKTLENYEDVDRCQRINCRPISDEFNAKIAKMDEQYKAKKAEYEKTICENCISGYCTYKLDGDCNALSDLCREYGGFNYIGCGDNDPLSKPLIDPKDVAMGDKPSEKPIQKQDNNQFRQKNNLLTNQGLTKLVNKPGVIIISIQTEDGVIKKILNKVDNSKATFKDKTDYYVTNNIKTKIGDKIGGIPAIGPYKDYIIKFFDDMKSDSQKTKDTHVQLGVGKNAATQFNKMDGIGETELKLSTAKNLIPSTPVTKPFEFIFTQLGNGVKKTMAHGFSSEYNSALAQARQLRDAGLTWSDTIKQTIKLVGEETDGKRWVQTLDAFSKKDYKTQDARIKAYIMQMKMNGELK